MNIENNTILKEGIMKRLLVAVMVLVSLIGIAMVNPVIAQQSASTSEQLVGTWTLVAAENVRADGSKVGVFGSNPKGTMIFSSDGHFALIQIRADLPKLASNSRDAGTPEENKAIVQGSIAYFGTYSVNDSDKVITIKLEGSTFANLGGEQRKIITYLTSDELTFINPRTPSGATLEVYWKRAK